MYNLMVMLMVLSLSAQMMFPRPVYAVESKTTDNEQFLLAETYNEERETVSKNKKYIKNKKSKKPLWIILGIVVIGAAVAIIANNSGGSGGSGSGGGSFY